MINSIPSSRLARFERALQGKFKVEYLEIENESAKHSGHYSGDGESHWRILLVTPDFKGQSRVQRHQRINDLLRAEFEQGLHALSLQLLDSEEWTLKKVGHFQ